MRKRLLTALLCSMLLLTPVLAAAADPCVAITGAKFRYSNNKNGRQIIAYPSIKYYCQNQYGDLAAIVYSGESQNGPWTSGGQTNVFKKPDGSWAGIIAFFPKGTPYIRIALKQKNSGNIAAERVFTEKQYDPRGLFNSSNYNVTTPKEPPRKLNLNN